MNRIKNEQGYALISVLLISVVFMAIAGSLIAQSFNTVKQNQLGEKNAQAVALAEMGINYYQGVVQNIYKAKQQTVAAQVIAMIDDDQNKDKTHSSAYYAEQAASLMRAAILGELEKSEISVDKNASFKLNNFKVVDDPTKFSLEIEGSKAERKADITTEMTIAPSVSGLADTETSGSVAIMLPDFNSIPKPSVDPQCKNPASLNADCTQILFDLDNTFNENNYSLSGKTIFTTGALLLNGNTIKMANMKIHSEQSVSIGNNMINLTNSVLETPSKLTVTANNFRLEGQSSAYIGENATITSNQFRLEGQSLVYIGGNAWITTNHFGISKGSKLCVAGNLTVSTNSSTIEGDLVIKDKISNDEFIQKCGISSTSPEVTWGDQLTSKTTYHY